MSVTDQQAGERPGAAAGASTRSGAEAQLASALAVGTALVRALRHLAGGLRKLAAAEVKVLRTAIPVLFAAVFVLVALAVTLWLCVVALIGWALMVGTHSLGLALGLLVILHVVLLIGVGWLIKSTIRQATFPRGRAELRLIARSLRHDVGRFTGATPDPTQGAQPASAPVSNEGTRT